MITIFTVPKAFTGHTAIIQTNAIRSWTLLRGDCEIILLGDDKGTAEIAAQYSLRHIPEIERNEYGTPIVSSIFDVAQNAAKHDIMCYVNADIILMPDFLQSVSLVQKLSFLIIGQRWDVDIKEPLDFDNLTWEGQLRARLTSSGKLHGISGLDYFVFHRGLYHDIPPFAIGRTGWDNWLVYKARASHAAVIDATAAITAVHQNHNYLHHKQGYIGVWKGQEAVINDKLAGSGKYCFTLDHANWRMTHSELKQIWTVRSLYFRLAALPVMYNSLNFLYRPVQILTKLIIHIRIISGKLRVKAINS